MNCSECGAPIPDNQRVLLNDAPLQHAEPCFAKALRRLEFKAADWSIDVNALSAETAYRLGKQTVATIVASRRRVKKKR